MAWTSGNNESLGLSRSRCCWGCWEGDIPPRWALPGRFQGPLFTQQDFDMSSADLSANVRITRSCSWLYYTSFLALDDVKCLQSLTSSLHILFTHAHTHIYVYIYRYISLCITTLRCNATAMGLTCPGTNLTGDAGRPYKALWSFGPQTPEPMRCLAVVCVCFLMMSEGMWGCFGRFAVSLGKFIHLLF